MKKIFKTFVKYSLSVICLLLFSCVNDVDLSNVSSEIIIDQSLVFPIGQVNTSLNDVYDFIGDQNELVLEGDEFNLIVKDSVAFKFSELELNTELPPYVAVLDFSNPTSKVIPANTIIPVNNSQRIFDLGFGANPEIERLDSVKISSGVFEVEIQTEDLLNVDPSDLKFNLVVENGNSDINIDISPSNFNSYYQVILPSLVLRTANNAELIISLNVSTGERPITFNPSSKIIVKMKYNTLKYDVVYGKFNQAVLSTKKRTLKFEMPLVFENSMLKFANPKLDITAISNVGAALSLQINSIDTYNIDNPLQKVSADFGGNKFYNFIFDKRPLIPGDTVMQKIKQLNRDFGALDKLFDAENFPNRLDYEFSVHSKDEVSGITDFLIPDTNIKLLLDAKIPLHFNQGSFFSILDRIPNVGVNICSLVKDYVIDTTIVVLTLKNGLPVKAKFKMVDLVDSLGAPILQSGFNTEYIVPAATVDANGIVTKANQTMLYIKVGRNQLEELKRMDYLSYKVTFDAETSSEQIHFTKNNTFGVKLGLYLKSNTIAIVK